jgi:hypothetical protein
MTGLSKNVIQIEFEIFKTSENRPADSKFFYKVLLTIQPTSVNAELALSACELFAIKLKCQLNDDILYTRCFMRHYMFINKLDFIKSHT